MKCLIGASTWSQKDWVGNFYPPKTKPADYLSEYAKRLPTVEIDSTFYAIPRASVVDGWRERTPPDFAFSAKLPKVITHEKRLRDSSETLKEFLNVISRLQEKLGALLIQLPPDFVATLETVETMKAFLGALPTSEFRFALEARHRSWLKEKFFDRLRLTRVALALTDQPAMTGVYEQTTSFVYVRWLGDRRRLSEPFTTLKLDKTAEMKEWAKRLCAMKGEVAFGYFNNHYAGHSPSSAALFNAMLSEIAKTEKGDQ
ncbi:MAG: DUF72 domain-containing protein [Chloroherpetonaceae bacterium]|nr:DUF72 domain-containing protein [Chloroherpetonaceae bacterium]MDW8437988.1 DUF72 domain-containing protein [Chloroherpetonaceae bacterium]